MGPFNLFFQIYSELRVGDHILIKNMCGSINAIFIDEEQSRCVYLDTKTGFVTETYLSTICNDRNKLYRYDYSTKATMPPKITVLNSKWFAARGKFNDYCLCQFSTSYDFAYNCKVNKYTGSCITINDNHGINQKHDCELLSTETNAAAFINASALTLCINEESESSITNNHPNLDDIIGGSIGGERMNQTHTNTISPNKNKALATQINRVYESQNVLLKKLQAMDEEIKNIQNRYFNQESEKQTLIDVTTERLNFFIYLLLLPVYR